MRLLVTRPEPDCDRTAIQLRARGHEVMLAPLLRVVPVDFELGSGPWDALVLTSVNAVRGIAGRPWVKAMQATPVYAVGRRSAAAARALGFRSVTSADGDAKALERLIKSRHGAGVRLLYLAGENRSRDLDLSDAGIAVVTAAVYRAVAVPELPADVRTALAAERVDGVLHFSRRSSAIYLTAAAGFLGKALVPAHYCLSSQVAEPLRAAGAERVLVARHPREADLLDLVAA